MVTRREGIEMGEKVKGLLVNKIVIGVHGDRWLLH